MAFKTDENEIKPLKIAALLICFVFSVFTLAI